MKRVGKWKLQLLLCILGLGGLTVIAGSSAAAPVDPNSERQVRCSLLSSTGYLI